eukprot:4714085-Prymnesium_polylepis.2
MAVAVQPALSLLPRHTRFPFTWPSLRMLRKGERALSYRLKPSPLVAAGDELEFPSESLVSRDCVLTLARR